jgi:hypothetical protein
MPRNHSLIRRGTVISIYRPQVTKTRTLALLICLGNDHNTGHRFRAQTIDGDTFMESMGKVKASVVRSRETEKEESWVEPMLHVSQLHSSGSWRLGRTEDVSFSWAALLATFSSTRSVMHLPDYTPIRRLVNGHRVVTLTC